MTMRPKVFASLLTCLARAPSAEAVQYFVDCDNGNDGQDGLSRDTPWRYPPGSPDASGGVSSSVLPRSGDEIRIRGLCATSIDVPSAGTAGAPVRWIGTWPGDDDESSSRAVLWGGAVISSVTASASNVAPELVDHELLEHLVVSETVLPSSIAAATDGGDDLNLFQGSPASPDARRLRLAQWPNAQPNPFRDDDLSRYVPVLPKQVTATSLRDSRLGVWGRGALEGSHVLIWVYGNRIERRLITYYDEDSHMMLWNDPILPYQDRDTLYSLQGAVEFISEPGEYAVLDGKVVAYPYEEEGPGNNELTVSVRTRGIDLKGQAHNSIESLQITQYGGTQAFEGTAIYNGYQNTETPGIRLRSLTIRHNYKRRGDTVRLNTLLEPALEDLIIERNANQRAIAMIASSRGIMTGNAIHDGSLACFGCDHFIIADNVVGGDLPLHANGITVYQESHGTIVARNRVEPSSPSIALTVKQSDAVRVLGNVLTTSPSDDVVTFALWAHATDSDRTVVVASNYLSGRTVMSGALASCTLVNNALGGLDSTVEAYRGHGTIHHNLHHALSWNQNGDKYGWTPFPNETVAADLPEEAIFDHDTRGLPAAGSPLIGAGDSDLAALVSDLERSMYAPSAELLLNYLRIDADGTVRDGDGRGPPDIGALEYAGPVATTPTPPASTSSPTPAPGTSSPTAVPTTVIDDPSLIARYALASNDLADSSGRSQPAAWWRSAVYNGGCDGTTVCGPKNAACKCFPEPDLSDPSYHGRSDFSASQEEEAALSLDGSDYVLIPDAVRLQIVNSGQVTAGVWARPAASGGYLFYQHKGISIRVDAVYVHCNVGTTDNGYPDEHYRDIKAVHDGIVFDGGWHHFAVTYDGSAVTCFVDGVAMGGKPSTGTIPEGYSSWSVGLGINTVKILWGPQKGLPLRGSLRDFRVYSRGLGDDEVATLAGNGLT